MGSRGGDLGGGVGSLDGDLGGGVGSLDGDLGGGVGSLDGDLGGGVGSFGGDLGGGVGSRGGGTGTGSGNTGCPSGFGFGLGGIGSRGGAPAAAGGFFGGFLGPFFTEDFGALPRGLLLAGDQSGSSSVFFFFALKGFSSGSLASDISSEDTGVPCQRVWAKPVIFLAVCRVLPMSLQSSSLSVSSSLMIPNRVYTTSSFSDHTSIWIVSIN